VIDAKKPLVFHATIDGERWRIAAIYGAPGRRWAWLVNIDKSTEQVRLSMKHPDLAQYAAPNQQTIFSAQKSASA